MTVEFGHPALLLLLPLALLPWLKRARPARTWSSLAPLAALPFGWRARLARWQAPLAALCLALCLLALADPAQLERRREVVRRGIDLMLALDVSASMRAADLSPNRMQVARNAAAAFLRQRGSDRIGVLLFSGAPYLLAPPSLDRGPVIAQLLRSEADRSGSGTALGDALAAAVARLTPRSDGDAAVILLTDGSSNRGRLTPLAAARAAAALGVRVYTIGFGSLAGADVELAPGPGGTAHDVLTEAPLQQIAALTGGRYFRATDGDALAAVYRQIDRLESSPLQVVEHHTRRSLRAPLAAGATVLLLLELLLFRLWLRSWP